MEFLNRFLSIIYPNRCPYCGEIISPDDNMCEECEKNLPRIKQPVCEFCGCNLEDCDCNKKHKAYKSIIAPFYYEGPARNAIHRMKFRDKPFIAKPLSKEISKSVNERYNDKSFDVITCVPMMKKELNSRGYNQSELLAKYLDINGEPEFKNNLLKKIYSVPPQHTLNETQRKGNVLGIFEINKDYDVNGKTILLCDDVKTTGSTANECASVLVDNGAKEVYLCCVALTRKKK